MAVRNIAEFKAEVIPKINVKNGESISIKDVLNRIFSDRTNITTDYTEWKKTNALLKDKRRKTSGGDAATPQSRTVPRNKKKWFVTSLMDPSINWWENTTNTGDPDFILMGSSLILAPNILNTPYYPTQLNREEIHYVPSIIETDGKNLVVAVTDVTGKTDVDDEVSRSDVDGSEVKKKKMSPRTGLFSTIEPGAEAVQHTNANATNRIYTNTLVSSIGGTTENLSDFYTPNIWSDAIASDQYIQQYFEEITGGGVRHKGTAHIKDSVLKRSLFGAIQSKFYLRKNQPFSLELNTTETAEDYVKATRRSGKFYNPNSEDATSNIIEDSLKIFGAESLAPTLKDELSDNSAIIIEIGSRSSDGTSFKYCLVFYYTSDRWALFKEVPNGINSLNETQYIYSLIDGPTQLKGFSSTSGAILSIYPVGNELVLSKRVTGKPDKEVENSITFRADEPMLIGEGKITVYLYGAPGTIFNFLPLYHRSLGYTVSDVKNFNYIVGKNNKKVNLDYIGKVGLEYLQKTPITFPHVNDSEKLYEYLNPCKIEWGTNTVGGSGGGWFDSLFGEAQAEQKDIYFMGLYSNKDKITIARKTNGDIDEDKENVNRLYRYYSPGIYAGEFMVNPIPAEVNLVPDGDVELKHVKAATINQTVEGYNGSITLYNKSMTLNEKEGLYTNDYRIKGVKPVKIDARIKPDNVGVASYGGITSEEGDITATQYNRLFTGFIVDRSFARSGSDANSSTVTLTLDDATIRAKDTYAIDMPIFDGWCHLAVFYYLAKYCGYEDNEIVLFQNPYKEHERYRVVDYLLNGGKDFIGKCFDGHTTGFPKMLLKRIGNTYLSSSGYPTTSGAGTISNVEQLGVVGEVLHACLPLNGIHEAPNYMFQMGTPVWDCMREIAEFSGFYLFANNWGSIVYSPQELALSPYVDFEFSEMPTDERFENISNFNEILANLNVNNPTEEIRNTVITQGLIVGPDGKEISPLVSIKQQQGWPHNVKDATYIPWLRYLIQRDPHWNDPKRLQWNNTQMFDRVSRERAFGSWGAWGRGLYPYQTFKVSESHSNETGADQEKFIASAITHNFTATNYMWTVDIEGERYESKFKFSPQVS